MLGDTQQKSKWKNSADATILAGKCTLMPTAKNIITTTKQIIICKNYQLLFNHTFSTAWNLNVALHYTKGDGYYEEYKDGRYLIEYGLKPFTIDGTEVSKSDLVRQKEDGQQNSVGGVFSLNYTAKQAKCVSGRWFEINTGANNFGKSSLGEKTT